MLLLRNQGGLQSKTMLWSLTSKIAIVFVLLSLSGCAQAAYSLPDFDSPPQHVEFQDFKHEYHSAPEEILSRYRGEELLFTGIEAEVVTREYLQSGGFRFRPEYRDGLDHIGPDFVVDVIGTVKGDVAGYFYIDNCTFIVVEGYELPPPRGY